MRFVHWKIQNIDGINVSTFRYLDSIRYGLMSRAAGQEESRLAETSDTLGAARAREKRVKYYTLMVYEDADATLLRLFECFMESAPQLVLQVLVMSANFVAVPN